MLYLLAVVVVAVQWGRGPAVVAATLGVLAFDLFVVPPRLSFDFRDTQYLLTFAALLVVGVVISNLAGRVREQAVAVRRREAYTTMLYALSNDLAAARDVPSIVDAVARQMAGTFDRDTAVLLPSGDTLRPAFVSPGFPLDPNELAVATYAFRHGESTGYGTDTLPGARGRYLPLKTAQGVVGVLGIRRPPDGGEPLTPEQRRLVQAFANQVALAIERANLADVSRRLDLSRETEKLQSALLNSISHDLRTPLASITGALSSVLDADAVLDPPTRRELLEAAREQADYLNRLVGNLLEMTRLGGGAVRLRLERVDIEDLVGASLTQMGAALDGRDVKITVEPNLPQIPMDFVLMIQALMSIVDNAVRYTPPNTPIDVRAWWEDGEVRIQIADRGAGRPAERGRPHLRQVPSHPPAGRCRRRRPRADDRRRHRGAPRRPHPRGEPAGRRAGGDGGAAADRAAPVRPRRTTPRRTAEGAARVRSGRRALAGAAQPQQVDAVSLDQEPAVAEARPREGLQHAVRERFHGAAPFADEVIVVAVGEPEMGGAPQVDLLDHPGGPQPLEDAVHGHEPEAPRPSVRAFPDRLTGGEVRAAREGVKNRNALRGDPELRAAQQVRVSVVGGHAGGSASLSSWSVPAYRPCGPGRASRSAAPGHGGRGGRRLPGRHRAPSNGVHDLRRPAGL